MTRTLTCLVKYLTHPERGKWIIRGATAADSPRTDDLEELGQYRKSNDHEAKQEEFDPGEKYAGLDTPALDGAGAQPWATKKRRVAYQGAFRKLWPVWALVEAHGKAAMFGPTQGPNIDVL